MPEATRQLPHSFGVRAGFRSPLGGGPIVKEHQRAHHLIAPWDVIDKVEVQLGKIRHRCHGVALPSLCGWSAGSTTTTP